MINHEQEFIDEIDTHCIEIIEELVDPNRVNQYAVFEQVMHVLLNRYSVSHFQQLLMPFQPPRPPQPTSAPPVNTTVAMKNSCTDSATRYSFMVIPTLAYLWHINEKVSTNSLLY